MANRKHFRPNDLQSTSKKSQTANPKILRPNNLKYGQIKKLGRKTANLATLALRSYGLILPAFFFSLFIYFTSVAALPGLPGNQRWADCHILRSRSSPDFLKLSPSPTTVQIFFKYKVQVQMKSNKLEKRSLFATKMSHFFSNNSDQIRFES